MSDSLASSFDWCTERVTFYPGETIAAALQRRGIVALGSALGGVQARYFCGIGTCQACLVSVNGGSAIEACLTLAAADTQVMPALSAATNATGCPP